jgi:hypothetical protein
MSKGGGGGAMQGGRGQQQTSRGQQQGGFGQQRGGFAQEQVGYGNQGGNYQYRNPRSSYMGNRGAKGGFGMQAPPPRSGLGNYGQQSDYRGSMGGKGGQQQRGYNPPSAPNYGEIGRGAMGRGSKGGMSNMGGGLNNSSIPAPQGGPQLQRMPQPMPSPAPQSPPPNQGGIYRGGSKDFSDQNYRKVDPSSLYSDPNMGGGAKGGRQPAPQDQATLPAPRLGAMVQPLQDQSPPSPLYSGDMSDNKIREDISARNQRGFQGMFDFEQPQIGQQQVDNYRLEMTNPDAYRQKLSSAQGLASLASQEPPMQGQPMGQVQPMARQVQPMARQVQPMARQVQFPRSRGR